MLASHKWLVELMGFEVAPSEIAKRLTAGGIEVETTRAWGENLGVDANIVVAEVRARRAHPARESLSLVTVFDGVAEQEVVCGAKNVPGPGGLVAFARLGAVLPGGMRIEERKLGGVVSCGMICSETELDLGADADGILVLDAGPRVRAGAALADALDLRDTVFALGLTPNRPDCLGHVGLARELCALLEQPFAFPKPRAPRKLVNATTPLWREKTAAFSLAHHYGSISAEPVARASDISSVSVRVADPERCPRYGAALVSGLRVARSPFPVRYRLHVLGLRAISNVVDATNVVLLAFGHPIHAFDLAKVRGGSIEVRLAKPGESLQTLDGQARALDADDLVICDSEGPVALAGVMGGAGSEIGPSTEHVLIECAYFDPRTVRRTSKRTGLHTDSSHRFERGVDISDVRQVLAHAASIIAELGDGAVAPDAVDVFLKPVRPPEVTYRNARARALLGADTDVALAHRIFERLGCKVSGEGEELRVVTPAHRPDLSREVDLIEEYARVVGYDAIPTQLPYLRPSASGTDPEVSFVRRVREAAAAVGLSEAVNFAFLAPIDLEKAHAAPSPARIANPMSEERVVLRTALLPGLLQNLAFAQRHAQQRLAYFEVAHVFSAAPDTAATLPDERYQLGVLLWGLRASSYEEREQLDFYDGKGALEGIVHALSGAPVETIVDAALETDAPFLHPKRRARVCVAALQVGVLGELHPDLVRAHGLSGRPVYATIELGALFAACRTIGLRQARALPRFPAATRDLAVVVADDVASGAVARALHEAAGALAESVKLFDIYRGAPVPDGKKSLAFHVVYRDPTATLTDKLVDETHAKLAVAAEKAFGGSLR